MIVKGKRSWYRYLVSPAVVFLAPAVTLYTAFFIYPAIQAFYVSLHEWSGFSPKMRYIGLANFVELWHEEAYRKAIFNNFVFMICGGIAMFFFSLLFAAVLSNRRFPGRKFFKTVLFTPYVVSVVGIAILWTFIYDPNWGLLNSVLTFIADPAVKALHALGLTRLTGYEVNVVWLGSRWTAIGSLIAVMVWGGVGFYIVLLMAGIDRIPEDLYEASRMDGATEGQNFIHITLPLLRDVLIIAVSVHIIGSLKTFGLIWAMTKGTNDTQVMETYMYTVAFDPQTMSFRMGYGTAMTVVLFFLVVLLTFTFNKVVRRSEVEY